MGRQTTGGYSMNIVSVQVDRNNNVEVIVKENRPKPGEMVTYALTYPRICLELNQRPNSIKIVNTEGKVYNQLRLGFSLELE